MADHIRKGVVKVALSEDADCEMLAAYDSAVARGLAVQSRNGASREKLSESAGRRCVLACGQAGRRVATGSRVGLPHAMRA